MKKIKEWLEELPEPHRTEAIKNTPELNGDVMAHDLKSAIWCAFVWDKTIQGHQYWEKLYESIS